MKQMTAERNLTEGNILKTMLIFAVPMILGNLLQQVYNIADTMVVGRFLGAKALAAVGSAYTLMTFLNSVIIGLCMGSGAVFSIAFGAKNEKELKESMWSSFLVYRRRDGSPERDRIYLDGSYSDSSSDSGRCLSSDVRLHKGDFRGDYFYLSL